MVSTEAGASVPLCNVFRLAFRRVTKDYLIGIALLLVVVVLWTLSSFITQGLFIDGFHKPFLVTYLNTSSFTLYLLPFLFRHGWNKWSPRGINVQDNLREQYEVIPTSDQVTADGHPFHGASAPSGSTLEETAPIQTASTQMAPLTTSETVQLASIFCFLWFIANWLSNASLNHTSVASGTVLSSTSSFFTLALGRLFAVESLTRTKLTAVVVSFIGVLLVSLSDSTSSNNGSSVSVPNPSPGTSHEYPNPLLGDVLAISAAMFYASYVILLKVRIRSESRIDMQLLFGFVGAVNIVALVPVGLFLHLTGYEPFELPSMRKEWGGVLVNMFITLSSDYILVIAMLRTTPVVATLGLSLTIPLAMIGDAILNKPTKAQGGLGALLVLVGFGLVGWADADTGSQDDDQVEDDPLQEIPQGPPSTEQLGREIDRPAISR